MRFTSSNGRRGMLTLASIDCWILMNRVLNLWWAQMKEIKRESAFIWGLPSKPLQLLENYRQSARASMSVWCCCVRFFADWICIKFNKMESSYNWIIKRNKFSRRKIFVHNSSIQTRCSKKIWTRCFQKWIVYKI